MPAELVVVKGKDRGVFVALDKDGAITIGRSEGSQLRLKGDKKVSTTHARITTTGDRFLLEDLGSTNGTYVNGERIHTAPLRSGDRVKIGHTLLVFRTDTASVHLSDVALDAKEDDGDGDSKLSTATPAHRGHRSSNHGSKAAVSTGTRQRLAGDEALALGLVEVHDALAATGDLKTRLDAALRSVLQVTNAARAVLFLRDPDAGGLGAAAAIGREDSRDNAPIDSDALRRAVGGELAAPSGEQAAAAAPVRAGELVIGALYVDSPGGRSPSPREGRFLGAVANAVSLAVRNERFERLVGAAIEVVGLAQTPPSRAVVDAKQLAEATERLYGPAAHARGLAFDIVAAEPLSVVGDELLLSRALDRLVEAALVSAKTGVRVTVERGEVGVRVLVARGGPPLSEALGRELVAAEGPVGDLKSALARLSDGSLAFARAAVARSGGRLAIETGAPPYVVQFVLELPLAT